MHKKNAASPDTERTKLIRNRRFAELVLQRAQMLYRCGSRGADADTAALSVAE